MPPTSLLLDLLPLMLGAALAPLWLVILLLILQSRRGLVKATAFVTGITLVRLLQGWLFGYVLGQANVLAESNVPRLIMALLLIALGLMLLISALKSLVNAPDPDAPPPKLFQQIDRAKPLNLLGIGIMLTTIAPKFWVFTLAALGIIREANLDSLAAALTAYAIYILGAQSLLILPLLLYAVVPGPASGLLRALNEWLTANQRVISLVVSLVFGGLFFWKGWNNFWAIGF
ncbi:MAG: GAP family protein [Spirulina sp.]